MDKKKLLTISEMSKLTEASAFSLRYYERIKILKPAFTDPKSGYRYYSFEQVFLVKLIMICVEMDIPLKSLAQFTNETGTIDYRSLLAFGKQIAEDKLQSIQRKLRFVDDMEQKITLASRHRRARQIYSREIPEKLFHVIPYNRPFDEPNPLDVIRMFIDFDYSETNYTGELVEYGLMCRYSPSGIMRYVFVEVEVQKRDITVDISVIPSGKYFCVQNSSISIEKTPKIFAGRLKGVSSYLAIETAFYMNNYKVDSPISELRVIGLS